MADSVQLGAHRDPNIVRTGVPGPIPEGAFRHGCRSLPTLIPEADEMAQQIRAAIAEECPWLTPLDDAILDLFALALARIRRGEAWLAQAGDYEVKRGSVAHRRLVGDLRAWGESARRYAGVLGLTPEARMSLKVGASRARALDTGTADPGDVAALEARIMARLDGKADE